MELKRIELLSEFRSLQPGFNVSFRKATGGHRIEPKCLVGLNGSGKSNVLEVISEIFFFIEAAYHEEGAKYNNKKAPFGFIVEYNLLITNENLIEQDGIEIQEQVDNIRSIKITKKPNEECVIEYWWDMEEEKNTLFPETEEDNYVRKLLIKLLPDVLVSYSSGHNEVLSNPYLKMNAYYYDHYTGLAKNQELSNIQINKLFNLSFDTNAAVVLCNYLMKGHKEDSSNEPSNLDESKNTELDLLNNIIGIQDLHSFDIEICGKIKRTSIEDLVEQFSMAADPAVTFKDEEIREAFYKYLLFPSSINETIEKLFDLASSKKKIKASNGDTYKWKLSFVVDEFGFLKGGFRDKFPKGALTLFNHLYFLEVLNYFSYSKELRERVKEAGFGDNVSEMLYSLPDDNRVFKIHNVTFRRNKKGEKLSKLAYRHLSDGEHQYLQMIGSAMLIERPNALFLFDEPDTHFNPEWRSTLVRTYNEVIEQKSKRLSTDLYDSQNVFLTTHSPFIISDCFRTNVISLKRNSKGEVDNDIAPFNTFGASVRTILKQLFDKEHMIPEKPLERLKRIKDDAEKNNADFEKLFLELEELGESLEKFKVTNYIIRLEEGGSQDA